MEAFYAELKTAGLNAKFIRVPYGLVTELEQLLRKRGAKDPNAQARDIIKGNTGASSSAPVQQTARDFRTLQSTIDGLGLHLWGGSRKGTVSVQSWEAETAAKGTGRADTVAGLPNKMMRVTLPRRPSKTGSLVILCHDTTKADVDEVARDIDAMELVAKQTGTAIKYHSMSSLFNQVTGRVA